jgi:predicted nucleic acid-binding protein
MSPMASSSLSTSSRPRRLIAVDCSVMAGIFFEEPPAAQALEAIANSSADGLVAPEFLVLELANVVVSNRRRVLRKQAEQRSKASEQAARVDPSRIDPSRVDPSRVDPSRVDPSRAHPSESFASGHAGFYGIPNGLIAREIERRLSSADVTLESMQSEPRVSRAIQIAELHRLSVYDACYVALALELGATVATLDHDMRRAAADLGLLVLPSASEAR